jgi:hypothetical protein
MDFRRSRSQISSLCFPCRTWSMVVLASVLVCDNPSLLGQAADSQDASTNKSWTTTNDWQNSNTRTVESHNQSGNHALDTQSIERRGFDGGFEPYVSVEKETVQVDSNTVRTVTRTYDQDTNGVKTLRLVTEEETHSRPDGSSNVVRSTSNADANGGLQLVQREIEDTNKIGENVEETQKTVLRPSVNGGLTPAKKVQERRTRDGNDTVNTETTTLVPNGAGNWQVREVRQTTEQGGKDSSKEEKLSRSDAEGNMGEVSHTVTKRTESSPGDSRTTVETYSVDVPGVTRDGRLHLVERATTVQQVSPSGQTTEKYVETPRPGDPTAGLQVTVEGMGTVRPDASGAVGTETVQMRDANDNLVTVSVDISKSTDSHILQVQMPPSDKTKPSADKSKK